MTDGEYGPKTSAVIREDRERRDIYRRFWIQQNLARAGQRSLDIIFMAVAIGGPSALVVWLFTSQPSLFGEQLGAIGSSIAVGAILFVLWVVLVLGLLDLVDRFWWRR